MEQDVKTYTKAVLTNRQPMAGDLQSTADEPVIKLSGPGGQPLNSTTDEIRQLGSNSSVATDEFTEINTNSAVTTAELDDDREIRQL